MLFGPVVEMVANSRKKGERRATSDSGGEEKRREGLSPIFNASNEA